MKSGISALFAACLVAACSSTVAQTQPMNSDLKQLDLDGDLVLFMNTDTVERRVLDYIDTIGDTLLASMQNGRGTQDIGAITNGLAKIKSAIEWSGLLSLQSYALSMAPVDGTLNRVIAIARHAEADGTKALWRIAASDPKVLKGIQYVPADAVYTANSTASLDEVWNVVNEAIAAFNTPEQAAAFNMKIAMAEMLIGTNIAAITGTLDNEILLSLQLSEEREVTIPQGTKMLSIPEPNLLIGFQTKEPLLGKILLDKLRLAQMPLVESAHGTYTLHTLTLPLPLPVPVQPTLVMTEDYLLIGSTRDVVAEALDCRANQTGLVATPLYKKLLAGVPEKTSAIEFMSPRFMQTYMRTIKQTLTAGQPPEAAAMMDRMLGGYENMLAGGYALKTPTGVYSKSHADYGGAKPPEMIAAAYVGMISAIAIPSFQKARSSAQEKACINNRRIIEAAKEQWAMENGKAEGTPVTEADIAEFIIGGKVPVCPKGWAYTINPIGTRCACSTHGALD